jgi:hypothetical protein
MEEMLHCVEAEALELFKPLEAIKEEKPREREVKIATIKPAKNEPYKPTRTSLPISQKTSTNVGTTPVGDKAPHNHDGRYPQRRFRPRPKTRSVHSALA